MMHQNKLNSKTFTRIRYFSYSIPPLCIMLLLCLAILPGDGRVYAKCAATTDIPSGYTQNATTCEWIPNLTPTEDISVEVSTTPTASLSIDGKTSVSDSINSSYGTTNYASHTVSVSVAGAGSYELILSGPAKLSGPSTISATSGATGANLANDTWGYAWENTTVTDPNANYKALGSNIKLSVNALSNQAASFSKKLAFAAKFDKADAGIYHADVSLSLVATPKYTTTTVAAVPWDKMVYMQDMSSYACESVAIGTSKTLKDIRDDNTYTVAKLSDGKCWMTQNLRLNTQQLKSGLHDSLNPYDSNIDSAWTMPKTLKTLQSSDFADETNKQTFYYDSTLNTYGTYYSWCAATAGDCSNISTGGKIANSSICPKGFVLPTEADWKNLLSSMNMGDLEFSEKREILAGAPYNFVFGGTIAKGENKSLDKYGEYWSSTSYDKVGIYHLSITTYSVNVPAGVNSGRFSGRSVRCVAK